MAIWCELEAFDEGLVGHERDIDDVAFCFSDLVQVGFVGMSAELSWGGCLLSVGGGRHLA